MSPCCLKIKDSHVKRFFDAQVNKKVRISINMINTTFDP